VCIYIIYTYYLYIFFLYIDTMRILYIYTHIRVSDLYREVGGWGRDPKKCTGRDWGMGSSTIQ